MSLGRVQDGAKRRPMACVAWTILLGLLLGCGSSVTPSDGDDDMMDVSHPESSVDAAVDNYFADGNVDTIPFRRESVARVLTGNLTRVLIELMPFASRPDAIDMDIDGCRVRSPATQGLLYGGAAVVEYEGISRDVSFNEEIKSYYSVFMPQSLPSSTLVTIRVAGNDDHPGFEVSERVPPPFRGILLPRPGTMQPFRSDRPFTIQWDGAPGDDFARVWVIGSNEARRRYLMAICFVPFSSGTYTISTNVLRMFDDYPFSLTMGIGRTRIVRTVVGNAPLLFYVERYPSESSLRFQ
jgi:hypothetical protein